MTQPGVEGRDVERRAAGSSLLMGGAAARVVAALGLLALLWLAVGWALL